MNVLYIKPSIKNYSAGDILEELCPCQNQYTTTTTLLTDDWMIKDPENSYDLGSVAIPDKPIVVGDTENHDCLRGFFSFDISSIHSTVVSATLKIYQVSTTGSPYTELGNLVVDHVDFGTLVAGAADFDNNDLTRSIASTGDSADNNWKEIDAKSAVQADIDAGRSTSQYRVRFAADTTGDDDDYIYIEDSENYCGTGNKAQLVVTYY